MIYDGQKAWAMGKGERKDDRPTDRPDGVVIVYVPCLFVNVPAAVPPSVVCGGYLRRGVPG
jgi:hypothetical protein